MVDVDPAQIKEEGGRAAPPHPIDADAVRNFLALVTEPGTTLELRFIGPENSEGKKQIETRCFAVDEGLGEVVAASLAGTPDWAIGTYWLMNPLPAGHDTTPKDGDILRRRWLLIDVDPSRPLAFAKDMATDGERQAALGVATRIRDRLGSLDWPAPVVVESGNGAQLLYRLDLPNDKLGWPPGGKPEPTPVTDAVAGLLRRLSYEFAGIDTSVSNPARLARLPGTWNKRGNRVVKDRPFRMARLVEVPDPLNVVTLDQINAACPRKEQPKPPRDASRMNGRASSGRGEWTPERRAIAYLEKITGGVSGAGGSKPTFWAARVVVYGYDLGEEAGFRILSEHYNHRCVPPWSEAELRHKCRDADTKSCDKVRGWLLNEDRRNGYANRNGHAARSGTPSNHRANGEADDHADDPQPEDDNLAVLLLLAEGSPEEALDAALLSDNLAALVSAKAEAPAELEKLYRALERGGIPVRRVERLRQAVSAEAKAGKKKRQEERRQERTAPPADGSPPAVVTNYKEEPFENDAGESGVIRVGLPAPTVAAAMLNVTCGWPKAASGVLFAPGPDGSPAWLGDTAKLFGWLQTAIPLGERNGVLWADGHDKVGRSDYHAALPSLVERYDAVESFPHEPAIQGHYYMHPPLPRSDGRALRELVRWFCPATPIDFDLIEAFFLSLFWGGPYGQRPAWLFTGTEDDDQCGRGIGKSTVAEMGARLVSGSLTVDQDEKMSDVVKRLLSDEGLTSRLVLLDNLKTLKFSWGQLEALITTSVISGHRMYQGEGRRPNTLTVALTLNGASLSKDMAQRAIPVWLVRPAYSPSWREDTAQFIEDRRWEIVADCIARLRVPGVPMPPGGRWSAWERGVLSRVAKPGGCQKVILERQAAIDEDTSESDIVRDWFVSQLEWHSHNPQSDRVFIPARIAGQWTNDATGERRPVGKACSYLVQLGLAEVRRGKKDGNRGYVWAPVGAKGGDAVALKDRPDPFKGH